MALLLLLVGCHQTPQYARVEGTISDADGQWLYLMHRGLYKTTTIDSVKLDTKGEFEFRIERPAYPDFYQLVVAQKSIILGVDSIEKISVIATYKDMYQAQLEGSPVSTEIQQLRQNLVSIEKQWHEWQETSSSHFTQLPDTLDVQLSAHKHAVRAKVLEQPTSLSVYYALFQQLDGHYIFSPYEKEDRPYFQAVATAYQLTMPDYERTKNLSQSVLMALKQMRAEKVKRNIPQQEVGLVEVVLKNRYGYPQKLSSYIGVPIVLDFVMYESENATNQLFDLQELYDKYHSQSLEIYQVSVDNNKLLWEQQSSSKPWICVYDGTGRVAKSYNVETLPTHYLIDKSGLIVGKFHDITALEKALIKIL